jgi:hypothetical protein
LQQDNAPAHNALYVKQFSANKNITVLEHPPYSPDLASCDFYLFQKISAQRNPFCVGENGESKTAKVLNSRTEHDLQNYFEHWQRRLQLCVNSEENYFEGDHS